MNAHVLRVMAGTLSLSGCLSCSPSVEPLVYSSSPLRKAHFVFQRDDTFYSAYALLENEPVTARDSRSMPLGVALFDRSPGAITYLLNGRTTKVRAAVKDAFLVHQVTEVLVQEDKERGKKLVVINYQARNTPSSSAPQKPPQRP